MPMSKEIGAPSKNLGELQLFLLCVISFRTGSCFSFHVVASSLLKHVNRRCRMVGGFGQDVQLKDARKYKCIRCTIEHQKLETEEEG